MQVKLIVVHGQARQREMELELPAVIGRSRAAAVTIGDPMVSRQHCFLEEHGGMVLLRDNGSLNGTILDGQRIAGEAIIRPGAKVTVGPLTFVVIYEPIGEGAQADTGLMPPTAGSAPDAPDFEALMAGAGNDAGAEEEAAADEADFDESDEGAEASPGVEGATLQWLPPAATTDGPSFLPPPAAGPAQSPILPPPAHEPEEEQAKPARVARGKSEAAGQGKKSSAPDQGKRAATPKPASQDEPPAAKAPAFDWLGGRADAPADEPPTPPALEDELASEPADEADENQFADEETAEAADETGLGPTEQTPPARSPSKKTPKQKGSWWPFGKNKKSAATAIAADKPGTEAPPDEETGIGADDDTRQEAAEQPPGEGVPVKPSAGAPGAKIDLRPPTDSAEDEPPSAQPPADEDEDDDDDDNFKQFFKGIG